MGRFAVVVLLVAFAAPSAVAQTTRPTCFGSVATIVGGPGDDKMQGTSGPDVIASLGGDDFIVAGGGDDKICGGDGNDIVVAQTGSDSIDGGNGNDSIEAGPGNDTIIGGAGEVDGAFYISAPGPVTANLATGVATGDGTDKLQGIEDLDGGDFNDTLTGNSEINVLAGEAGNDTIDGGPSSDALVGGPGDDKLLGRPDDGDAAAYISSPVGVQADLNTGIATGEGRDTLTNIESLIGSNFADRLVGNSRFNFMVGFGGNDELVGGGGFDVALFLSPVSASLATGEARGGEGTDKLTDFEGLAGSAGADSLTGDAKLNYIAGGFGNDVLDGGGGGDIVRGQEGSDRLQGGAGDDLLSGGPDDDVVDGGAGTGDTATYIDSTTAVKASLATKSAAGEGTDTLAGIENLSGSQLGDELTGDPKPNQLFGNDGDDLLAGGAGSDFLSGGAGNNTLQPGPGKDYCLDEKPTPGCEINGTPAIPGDPEQPPLPTGSRSGERKRSSPAAPARPADPIGVLTWLARATTNLGSVSQSLQDGQGSMPIRPAIGPLPARSAATGAVRQTAGYEYSAEPVCISAGGKRITEIAPPKIVRPVGDDNVREEAWWQGTLYRQDRKTGKFTRQAKTAWARAQLAGDFVLSGVVAWKTVDGQSSYTSPVAIRVPKGKYVWKGQIFWVRSGGRIFAAIEPHIIRAKTIQHRKTCDFKK